MPNSSARTRPPPRRGAGAPGEREPLLSRPANRGPAEQEDWIGKLETRTLELQAEISAAETKLAAQSEQFGLSRVSFRRFPPGRSPRCAARRGPCGADGQAVGRGEAGRPRRAGNGSLAWRKGPVGLVRARRARSRGGHGSNRQPRGHSRLACRSTSVWSS